MTENSSFFLSIGKEVKDEYGRVLGKVASFAISPNGSFDSIYVRQNDGKFVKYPAEHVKIEDSGITILSKIKIKVENLCNQIPLIWRKDQALKELVEKKKISQEVYEDLHRSFDGVLNQLKSEAQAVMKNIDEEIDKCSQEIKELNYALVNLEIEHEIGKINDQAYQNAFLTIQECLKRTNMEKTDLETLRNTLSNMLLGEKHEQPEIKIESEEVKKEKEKGEQKAEEKPAASPNLPEPPVVVYVKEVGQSGEA